MDTNKKVARNRYAINLGAKGRLILPVEVRRSLDLEEGDRLVVAIEEDGSLRITTGREIASRCRGLFAGLGGGASAVAELIEERRAEARREAGEAGQK